MLDNCSLDSEKNGMGANANIDTDRDISICYKISFEMLLTYTFAITDHFRISILPSYFSVRVYIYI